jgi:hypothetical protein
LPEPETPGVAEKQTAHSRPSLELWMKSGQKHLGTRKNEEKHGPMESVCRVFAGPKGPALRAGRTFDVCGVERARRHGSSTGPPNGALDTTHVKRTAAKNLPVFFRVPKSSLPSLEIPEVNGRRHKGVSGVIGWATVHGQLEFRKCRPQTSDLRPPTILEGL